MSTDVTPGRYGHHKLLTAYADLLVDIGGVDGSFKWSDVHGYDAAFRKLRRSPLVRVEQVATGRKEPERYTLKDPAREFLKDHIESRDTFCPCDHAGIENHGEWYECGYDRCDERFAREEVSD